MRRREKKILAPLFPSSGWQLNWPVGQLESKAREKTTIVCDPFGVYLLQIVEDVPSRSRAGLSSHVRLEEAFPHTSPSF